MFPNRQGGRSQEFVSALATLDLKLTVHPQRAQDIRYFTDEVS